jgi:DNA-binding IclR family transcriptional regulator
MTGQEKIRTASGSDRPKDSTRQDRDEASYVLDVGLKIMKVFEALEGRAFEPISIRRVSQRTGFKENACRRYLITLKKAGWARQTLDGWIVGPKAEALIKKLSASLFSKSGE